MLTSLDEIWALMPFLDADKGGGGGGGAGGDDDDRDDQDDDDDITDEDDDIEDDDEDDESEDGDDDDDDEPLGKAGTKALRRERRRRRDAERKLRKLQRGNDDDEDDESDDDDADLESKLERTTRQLHEARAETALVSAATKAGAVSVRAVVALAREELKFDKSGKPRNLRSVMKALREDDPELFRAADGSADGGEGGGGAAVRDLNANLRRQIRKARRGS